MDRLPRGDHAEDAERAAVTVAIMKFILYFMTGRVAADCSDLRIRLAARDIAMFDGSRGGGEGSIELGTGDIVTLTTPDGTFRQYSPLVARLARTLAEARSEAQAISAMV